MKKVYIYSLAVLLLFGLSGFYVFKEFGKKKWKIDTDFNQYLEIILMRLNHSENLFYFKWIDLKNNPPN